MQQHDAIMIIIYSYIIFRRCSLEHTVSKCSGKYVFALNGANAGIHAIADANT